MCAAAHRALTAQIEGPVVNSKVESTETVSVLRPMKEDWSVFALCWLAIIMGVLLRRYMASRIVSAIATLAPVAVYGWWAIMAIAVVCVAVFIFCLIVSYAE